jgi:hypothetical protein
MITCMAVATANCVAEKSVARKIGRGKGGGFLGKLGNQGNFGFQQEKFDAAGKPRREDPGSVWIYTENNGR